MIIIAILTTIALILIAVLLFELIIVVHEGAHCIAAKLSGVSVIEFAIGMGPRLFGFTRGETTYSFRLFPIGGYCAMEGEEDDSENPRAFTNAKIWKRMIIIVAGAFMNIVFGVFLMMITLLPQDQFVSTTVSVFEPYSFSAATGLKEGDKIVKINDYDTFTSTDFSFALYTLPVREVDGNELSIYKEDCLFELYMRVSDGVNAGKVKNPAQAVYPVWSEVSKKIDTAASKDEAYQLFCDGCDQIDAALGLDPAESYPEIELKQVRKRFRTDMTVIRDGKRIELKDVDLMTYKTADSDKPQLEIDFYVQPIEKNFGTLMSQTFTQSVSIVRMVWSSLIGLIKGQFSLNDMSGPVGIASAITTVASESLKTAGFGKAVESIVYVMMVISINLGIVNMLPLPALDGGRFLMLLIEAIFRKPVPRKVEKIINAVGLALLIGFSVVIAVKDVWQIFAGGGT